MPSLINSASAIAELDRIGLGQFGFRDRYVHEKSNESRVKSQLTGDVLATPLQALQVSFATSGLTSRICV